MTASGMCSLHGLLRFARQNLPYQAFHLVAEDVGDEELSKFAQQLLDTPRLVPASNFNALRACCVHCIMHGSAEAAVAACWLLLYYCY